EMKKGSLWSKERSFEAFLPRVPRIGVEAGAYACFSLTQPRLDSPRTSLGVASNSAYPHLGIEAHAYAWIVTPQPQSKQSPRLDVIQEA
ncbi:hypothetical protein PIB30_103677, partial [Stylosanthes scabra]|nr:hypothetical protein [Stylosanthes scabra]